MMIDNGFEEFITNDGGSLFYIESNNGDVRRYYMGPNTDLTVKEVVPYTAKRHSEILQLVINGDGFIMESPPEEFPPEVVEPMALVNHLEPPEDSKIKIIGNKLVNTVSGESMDMSDPETIFRAMDALMRLAKRLKEESDK